MKKKHIILFSLILCFSLFSEAKYNCSSEDQKLEVDPKRKKVILTKSGIDHKLKILNPANHGFKMFGNTSQAFEIEGGYVVGIKDTKIDKVKTLSIFKRGEVIASFEDCTEK